MPTETLTNPAGVPLTGASGTVDYTTYKAADGSVIQYGGNIDTFIANAAVNVGDAVIYTAAVTATGVRVTPLPAGATQVQSRCFAGIALDSAPTPSSTVPAKPIRVQTSGIALVNIASSNSITAGSGFTVSGAATPAIGVFGVAPIAAGNTAGQVCGANNAATTLPGETFGTFLGGAIGSTGQAPFHIKFV